MAYELYDVLVNVLCLGTYLIIEVRTVERALELCGVNDAEVLLYVGAHLVCSRCREGYDGGVAYLVYYWSDAAVLRAEIVSPLGDAVCLIDGVERNLHRLQKLDVVFFRQRLRSHIKQFGASAEYIFLNTVDSCLI